MAATHGARLVTLGWQTWSVLAFVLALVLLAAALILTW